MASSNVKALLKKHPSLVLDAERSRVKCSLTNHEMPVTVKAIETYVNGKKYKKSSDMAAFEFDNHKRHIVASNKKKHSHEMFCTLTLRHIEKTPQAIQRHITGRKYTNALSRWLKCQETGEKFVPHVRRKGKLPRSYRADRGGGGGGGNDSPFHNDSNGDQSDRDSDNMSDLYPDEDLEEADDDEEDEEEEEEEENEDSAPAKHKKQVNKTQINRKPAKKQKQQVSGQEDDSGSDYDMGVVTVVASPCIAPPTSTSKLATKPHSTAPELNGLHSQHNSSTTSLKTKKKRKVGDDGDNKSEVMSREKKKTKKKKRKGE